MVYFVIFCGILLGAFLRKFSYGYTYPKMTIPELYASLYHLFKNREFSGCLEPLNRLDILNNLVIIEDRESYTINKKEIHLCTRDPQNGLYYDKNTLMFVLLHELSHVLCKDIGHTRNFATINHALLTHAIKHGYYDPSKPFVKNYCTL